VIGRWLAQGGRRDKVIATKVGNDMGEAASA
jgi:aryl-alcohol dehydrogenase-like predicted oxidoreductase